MAPRPQRAWLELWTGLALGGLALWVVLLAAKSYAWRMDLDEPYMLFMPCQWERFGLVPYRDVFEFNGPGGYFLNWLVVKLGGASDHALRVADLGYLAALVATSSYALRSFGVAALAGPLLFGAYYLCQGPQLAFEREYLMLLPIALALSAVASRRLGPFWRGALVGLALALAASVKPWALVALPGLALAAWLVTRRASTLAGCCVGLALGVGAIGGCLALWGAAGPFWDIVTSYYPLYAAFDGDNRVRVGLDAWGYRVHDALAYGLAQKRWLAFAALGLGCAWLAGLEARQRVLVASLLGLALAFAAGAALNGKFYPYHWLPLHYALALLAGLAFGRQLPRSQRAGALAAASLLVLLTTRLSSDIVPQWHGQPPLQPVPARVDEVVAYMRPLIRPGDTLQVLDYCNGGAAVATALGMRTATPFFTDFQFYHHVSTPTIQALRARFLAAFDAADPRFVLRIDGHEREMTGPDTTGEFAELAARLQSRYRLLRAGEGYEVFERASGQPPA